VKKQECFLNGLNDGPTYALEASLNDGPTYALEAQDFENFQGMVNKALVLENQRGVVECKRKLVRQHQSGSSTRPCVTTSSTGPVFYPAQP
jgi:hypothetical protein